MQNYSSRFKVKNLLKEDAANDSSTVLPVAVLLYLLYGKQDENIAKLTKKIIARNGVVQGVPSPVFEDVPRKSVASLQNLKVFSLRRPFNLPDLKDTKFDGRDLTVRLELKDVQILDVGPFSVQEKSRDSSLLDTQIEVDHISLFVTYKISGTINGESFDHSGKTDVFMTDFRGNAEIKQTIDVTSETFNISNLDLNFTFRALEFGRTGLTIKSVPATEVRRVLNSLGTKFVKQNMKSATSALSEGLKTQANKMLANRNREQIIQFLENYLNVMSRTPAANEALLFEYRKQMDTDHQDEDFAE